MSTSHVIATPYRRPAQRHTGVRHAMNGRTSSAREDAFVLRTPVYTASSDKYDLGRGTSDASSCISMSTLLSSEAYFSDDTRFGVV